jgi:uncharacterized membrane protein YdbT with pleckstrin-like domain
MSDGGVHRPDEGVTYEAQLHWFVFAPPLSLFAAGLVAIAFQPMAAVAFLLASIVAMVAAYLKLSTTRIVVTDRRIVYRTGLLARRTLEMNKDKVESIDVNQSIVGRLLDFGSVTVKGTGGGIEAISNVSAPFALRNHVAAGNAGPTWLPGLSEPAQL